MPSRQTDAFQIQLVPLWRRPDYRNFLKAITACGISSFMFGWHVHEKAVMLVLVPLRCVYACPLSRIADFEKFVSIRGLEPISGIHRGQRFGHHWPVSLTLQSSRYAWSLAACVSCAETPQRHRSSCAIRPSGVWCFSRSCASMSCGALGIRAVACADSSGLSPQSLLISSTTPNACTCTLLFPSWHSHPSYTPP